MWVVMDEDVLAAAVERFDFRPIDGQGVAFATASDRYAGWLGQVYHRDYAADTTRRPKRLKTGTFEEVVLPVSSVDEYFEHFPSLELDFTFYAPLLTADGDPTRTYKTLESYAAATSQGRFWVKAPEVFTAPTVRSGGRGSGGQPNLGREAAGPRFFPNLNYADPDAFRRQFVDPLQTLLGDRLEGVIFEQGYIPAAHVPPVAEAIEPLDALVRSLGDAVELHVELRTPRLLQPAYFEWLRAVQAGFVVSHWTFLPSIGAQFKQLGGIWPSDKKGRVVQRLLTPTGVRYEDAYAQAHPFDAPVPAITSSAPATAMIRESVAMTFQALTAGLQPTVIVNNRAWGNAPDLARVLARRVILEWRRRGERS